MEKENRSREILKLFTFFFGIGGGLISFLLYFFYRISSIKRIRFKKIEIIELSVIIIFFLSFLFSPYKDLAFRSFLVLLLLYITYLLFLRSENFSIENLYPLIDYWILGSTLLSFGSITVFLYKGTYAETTFLGKNGVGTLLATSLPLAQLRIFNSQDKLWHILCLLIITGGLILCMSQGAWIGLLLAEILLFILGDKKIRKNILFLSFLGLLLLSIFIIRSFLVKDNLFSFFLTRLDMNSSSKTERIYIWKSAWKMFLDHPITGIGVGTFGLAYPSYKLPQSHIETTPFAHNLPLNLLAETGILGFLSFTILTFSFFIKGLKVFLRQRDLAILSLLSGFTAYMVHQFFDGTMWSLHLGLGFWFLGAIFANLYES
ncbi:MAG: O-antigen ligase family protein [Dictyoglomaceae bacterium]